MSSTKKIVLITGANSGIGLEIVKSLCKSSQAYEIIIGARRPDAGQAAVEAVQKEFPSTTSTLSTVAADINSDDSIAQVRDEIAAKHGRVDVLINNAGANFDVEAASGKCSLREAWNRSWDTNVAGTVVMTTELIPLLLKSSDPRLMFVTSGTSSLTETERFDNAIYQRINRSPEAGWPKPAQAAPIMAYRSSKTGLNMVMRQFARILKNDGVKVWCISPGFLATGLANVGQQKLLEMGARPASEGGDFIKNVVEGHRDHDAGKVIRVDEVQTY